MTITPADGYYIMTRDCSGVRLHNKFGHEIGGWFEVAPKSSPVFFWVVTITDGEESDSNFVGRSDFMDEAKYVSLFNECKIIIESMYDENKIFLTNF